jgi:adenosylcobinamide-GDP ribazoletransferase
MTPQEWGQRLRTAIAELRRGERYADVRTRIGGSPFGRVKLGGIFADLRVCIAFYTRLPLPAPRVTDGAALARASWCAPLAGVLVGAIAAIAFWMAWRLNLPPFCCAALAVCASLFATGCLHEDGLADMADGLGGATRERALEIMRDGRIGTFGACALAMSFLLRVGSLADLPNAGLAAWALIGAHAAARGGLPLFMRLVPPARRDGLSASAGAPPAGRAWVSVLIGVVVLAVALGVRNMVIALVLMLVGAGVIAALCRRKIGGQTGDVLGALEQVSECIVLMVAAARF